MNVYVETNFFLELVLQQEQHRACEDLLTLANTGGINLMIPAYCLGEALATLIERQQERERVQKDLQR